MNGRAVDARGPQRRRVLAGGLVALGAGIAGGVGAPAFAAAAAESAELRRLAAQKGLRYGTAISAAQIAHDPAFVALALRQAALVVPENDMKWQDINQGASPTNMRPLISPFATGWSPTPTGVFSTRRSTSRRSRWW